MNIRIQFLDFSIHDDVDVKPINTLEDIIKSIKNKSKYTGFLDKATFQFKDKALIKSFFSKSFQKLGINDNDTIGIKVETITPSCIMFVFEHELKQVVHPDFNPIPATLSLLARRHHQKPFSATVLCQLLYHVKDRIKKGAPLDQVMPLYNFIRLLYLMAPIEEYDPEPGSIVENPQNLLCELTLGQYNYNSSLSRIKILLSNYKDLIIDEHIPNISLFFEALKTNKTIKYLELDCPNNITSKDAEYFSEALKYNKSLLSLCLDLQWAKMISKGLKNNLSLKTLTLLRANGRPVKGYFTQILTVNTFLQTLKINGCYFYENNFNEVSKGLETNISLKSLIIKDVNPDCDTIFKALKQNTMLTELCISLLDRLERNVDVFKRIPFELVEMNTTLKIEKFDYKYTSLLDKDLEKKMQSNEDCRKYYTTQCIETLLTEAKTIPAILTIPGHTKFEPCSEIQLLEIMSTFPFLIEPLCQIIKEYLKSDLPLTLALPNRTNVSAPNVSKLSFLSQNDSKAQEQKPNEHKKRSNRSR